MAEAKVRVIANNDIAYLWWSVPEKIPGCLGFSIHRQKENGEQEPLRAWVGFEKVKGPVKPKDTDVWPIQSFQWKDVLAPREGRFRYRIYAVRGTPAKPVRDKEPVLTTPFVELGEKIGKLQVVFNRGLLSTQAMNRGSNAPASNADALRKAIGKQGDKVRLRLAKELLPTLLKPLKDAQDKGGKCYAALYELTDEELITTLEKTADTQLILSNANSSKKVDGKQTTVYDGTNEKTRKRLGAKLGKRLTNRMLSGNSIGHNKFVVYQNSHGLIESVLTGSTNWTATGLCGQTNNAILIDDRRLAEHYRTYWKLLQGEKGTLQGPALRQWARENPMEVSLGSGKGTLKVWFSPNTKGKTKNAKIVPVDMAEVFQIIEGATSAVLFLLFNPGTPSIITKIKEVANERSTSGALLYVRGAISDPKTAQKGKVRVFSRSANAPADTVITGVSGVPDDFGYWERELLKLGHAAIHDKVLVVDPFSKNCVVVTGSHNLGFKASYANDENMVIIRGNRPVAEAFAAHVLDVVNHYKWRYKLQELHRKKQLNKAWQDLEDDDRWQDKYFRKGFLASRDRFVLR